MRSIARTALGRMMLSPVVGLLYAVALTVASQYYTRMFSRYMYLTLFVCAGAFLAGKIMAWSRRETDGVALTEPARA